MDRPKKIALVSPYDHAFHGGVADHISNLAAQFRVWGHDVRIIAPCSDLAAIDEPEFIPMGRPVPVPSGGSIARISLSVWLRPRIKTLLARERFDVVHLHEPFASATTLNVLSEAASLGSVTVGTFHTFRGTRLYRVGAKRFLMPYFNRLNGRIAVSPPAHQFISRHFPGDYTIIPNGINVDEFANAQPFPQLLNDGMLNLLFVGRLEKRKGLKYLLGAFSKLKWDWPNLRLIVVGPGKPDVDSYRIMSERNLQDVIFTGGVSDFEKARYFKSAHVYCSPATGRESFGIVLLEAMAAGKPVVASRIEGYSSVITHGREGLLVPPKNDEELADAIAILLKDSTLRSALSQRGRRRVEDFRWERVARSVMDYYETFLEVPEVTPTYGI
jgi:phosphatidylinositol alpha-mannosyltransferase